MCESSHDLEAQKHYAMKESKAIKIEARSGVIQNHSNCESVRPINEKTGAITSMVRQVGSAIFLKRTLEKWATGYQIFCTSELRRKIKKD